jgi:hypothetical protein
MNELASAQTLIRSLYLGDRYVKSMLLDSVNQQIKIVIDRISRVDPLTGNWDYYAAGDIIDGALVFDGVRGFSTKQNGSLFNDEISSLACRASAEFPELIEFLVEGSGVDDSAVSHDIDMVIVAKSISLLSS